MSEIEYRTVLDDDGRRSGRCGRGGNKPFAKVVRGIANNGRRKIANGTRRVVRANPAQHKPFQSRPPEYQNPPFQQSFRDNSRKQPAKSCGTSYPMVQFSVSPVAEFQFHNPSAEIVAAALLQANEEEIREIIPLHQVASVVFVVAFATACSVFLGLLIAGPLGRRESPMNGLQFLDQKLETVIKRINYFGTALFALSGSRTAGSRGMDLMGCVIVACITAMGGGTLAALFFGKPVYWVHEPEYVAIAVLAGIASFFLWPKIPVTIRTSKVMSKTLDWFDGICLSTFAVIGTDSALRNDSGILLALLSGVMTATFGGFTRDVVCRLPVRILHSHAEIYASCCLWAAALYTTLVMSAPALPAVVQVGIPILSTTFLRYLAWSNGLRLPVYKEEKPLF